MPFADLASVPIFASLPVEEIRRLEKVLRVSSCPPGKVLFQEGHSDDRFYILLEGQVEVVKALGRPEQRLLGVRESGNLLGEMSLFSRDGCHTASVRAVTRLRLLQVPHTELETLLRHQPALAYGIIRQLSQHLEESENLTIQDLKEKNARLRQAYDELADWNPQVAAYIVPNGFNRRVLFSMNLREAFAFCQLRSAPHAHFSMRRVAERVAEEIRGVHPVLAKYMSLPQEPWQEVENQHFSQT